MSDEKMTLDSFAEKYQAWQQASVILKAELLARRLGVNKLAKQTNLDALRLHYITTGELMPNDTEWDSLRTALTFLPTQWLDWFRDSTGQIKIQSVPVAFDQIIKRLGDERIPWEIKTRPDGFSAVYVEVGGFQIHGVDRAHQLTTIQLIRALHEGYDRVMRYREDSHDGKE